MDELLGPLPPKNVKNNAKDKVLRKGRGKKADQPTLENSKGADRSVKTKSKHKPVPGMKEQLAKMDSLHAELDAKRLWNTSPQATQTLIRCDLFFTLHSYPSL